MKKTIVSAALVVASFIYILSRNNVAAPAAQVAVSANTVPSAPVSTPASSPAQEPASQTTTASAPTRSGRRGRKVQTPVPATQTTTTTTPAPISTPVATPKSTTNSLYNDGTYTGSAADAYYGNVQVQVTVSGGVITNVTFLQKPGDRSTSVYINSQATPILASEAIKAQSASVNAVSGATDTSQAFKQSLSSALTQAKA